MRIIPIYFSAIILKYEVAVTSDGLALPPRRISVIVIAVNIR